MRRRQWLAVVTMTLALGAGRKESAAQVAGSAPGSAAGIGSASSGAPQFSSSTGTGTGAGAQAQEETSLELDKAEAAMAKSDWKTAEPLVSAWLAGHGQDGRALFDAGYMADAEGRQDEALGYYQRALVAEPGNIVAQLSEGLLLGRMNRLEESRAALEKAAALDPGPGGAEMKARAWRALEKVERQIPGKDGKPNYAAASGYLLQALKLTPETTDDALEAASLAEATGDGAGAEAAHQRVLHKDADNAQAIAGLAHLLVVDKKYAEAEALVKPARAKDPGNPALTAELATALVAEDKAEALPLLEAYHAKHPDDGNMTRMLAAVEADGGDYAGSDALYSKLLQASPDDVELLIGHGQNLIRLRRPAEALKVFERAAEIDGANGDAWNGVAFSSFELHQADVTLHALTMRSKYLPDSASIDFLWATAYDTLHQVTQATAYYHKFLDAAAGKFPDQEWQARQRLALLEKRPK